MNYYCILFPFFYSSHLIITMSAVYLRSWQITSDNQVRVLYYVKNKDETCDQWIRYFEINTPTDSLVINTLKKHLETDHVYTGLCPYRVVNQYITYSLAKK